MAVKGRRTARPAIAAAPSPPDDAPRLAPDATTIALWLVLLAALVAGGVAFAAWPRTPGDGSADAGFLRDMSVHHNQAVEMALIIRDRTADEQLRFLATDIVLTQTSELGVMSGWLTAWDLPFTGRDLPMAWMGHPTEGPMPGMASPDQIQQLRELPVAEAEVLFLRLMIRHHAGGIAMAEACVNRCDEEVVRDLAEKIAAAQQIEIGTMNSILQTRGQEPELPMSAASDGEE